MKSLEIEFENDKKLTIENNCGGKYPIAIEFGDLDEKHRTSLSDDEIKELIKFLVSVL